MATISTRVDDKTKNEAEEVANGIGITLSTAISIFLKQFIGNNGFPFDVVVPDKRETNAIVNVNDLDAMVKKAVADSNAINSPSHFTYLDPKTNKIITIDKGND